jgi:two-component system sensor histidine kinase AlgZ
MTDMPVVPRPQPVPGLWRLLLLTPLWAVPFALFFGTVFGARWDTYRLAYLDSLVFAFSIRVALFIAARWIVPALPIERSDRSWLPISAVHVVAAMLGSFAGAFAIHWFWQPGFLGGGGAIALLMVAMWSLLFSALFTGIILAYRFHQHAVERAAQVERIRAELVRAELRALRSQVNPHFLFNTLNSIAALIAENPVAAEDLTTRLADVFRYALTASMHEHARLADELEFVRTCLAIEHVRFGERLRIEESIEPGLDDVRVPPLLLQPLVENAVRHGVEQAPEGGVIRVRTRLKRGSVVISIDNSMHGEASRPGAGMALRNVRERLHLMHDVAAHFEARPEHGMFRVRIVLPA